MLALPAQPRLQSIVQWYGIVVNDIVLNLGVEKACGLLNSGNLLLINSFRDKSFLR